MLEESNYYSARKAGIISDSELEGLIARIQAGRSGSALSDPHSTKNIFASKENEEAQAMVNARVMLHLYQKRAHIFGSVEFSDPAWMILLYLFTGGSRPTSVSAACAASGAAPTTALRYLARLESAELIVRNPHPFDLRTTELQLTSEAKQGLIDIFY